MSLSIQGYGTFSVSEEKLIKVIKQLWDLRPASIITQLDLLQPLYFQTAAYGHFGREDMCFKWEKLDKVQAIKSEFS